MPEAKPGKTRAVIEVYFDCSSPWTYLGFQCQRRRAGADIEWNPILVGGVFNAVNPSVYEGRRAPVKAKARYHLKDLRDWADLAGLVINMPPRVFPVNSVRVMRACHVLKPHGKLPAFARVAFEAYWRDDRDISRLGTVKQLCTQCGVDADWLMGEIAKPETKDALKETTDELIARGGFGSPTFFWNGEMFFGNDRLGLIEKKLDAAGLHQNIS
ncbi:MAG: 2-hydroxychromene-2-carboxylate isomerase [Pseudomonadota bacterium]